MRQEQERLEQVAAKLSARIAEMEPEMAGLYDQVTDIRKRFWEEVTVNTSTDEDFEETFFTIRQQVALLSERERTHQKRVQQWSSLNRLLLSPYFGRIDFREEGQSESEPIYIGVSSFVETDGLNFLIYDWRSPIASMYYDYSPGAAAYETPGGRIAGTIELKRQYQIQGTEIVNLFDASLTIGDEILQQVLGQGTDGQMKSIVSTIQMEQNAIIRNEKSRMLIVQGAAGSGKTSAALQRVAYLLYKHRERLKADQIVLISPNPMFNSYVATVLPELGEENMQQTTFQDYLDYWLGTALQSDDLFDQIEYVLTAEASEGYEARRAAIAYKASEAFLRAIQNYASWLGQAGMRFTNIRFRGRDIITAAQMRDQFYSFEPSIRIANRVASLKAWLLKELAVLERKEREAEWVQEEIQYIDDERYADVYGMLHQEQGVFDFAEQYARVREIIDKKRRGDEGDFDFARKEEELLRRMVVDEHFAPLKQSVKQLKFIDVMGLYEQLFSVEEVYRQMTNKTEVPEHWAEVCRQTKEKLSRSEMFYEDASPYLYLKELIEGVRTNADIQHIFVDEGQDYSLFQYELLKRLFPRARMTVLGDFGQAIFPQATDLHTADSPLIQLYGASETNQVYLARSYRSTREIVAFTKSLLPGSEDIVPFERKGGKPLLTMASSGEQRIVRMAEDLAVLQAEGFASIAVITKTAAESAEAYARLTAQGCLALQLMTKQSPSFEQGTMVVPAYLAKGVEFDAVLIYDASAQVYHRESERKLFYTACTRAMHRLQLYANGEWTPYISGTNRSLYEVRM
nr:RNA polymerase recycling motor HelD [Paenibacillus sp. R14(2021)]